MRKNFLGDGLRLRFLTPEWLFDHKLLSVMASGGVFVEAFNPDARAPVKFRAAVLEVILVKTFAVLLLSTLLMSSCQQTEPLVEETKAAWLSPQTLPIGDGRITN